MSADLSSGLSTTRAEGGYKTVETMLPKPSVHHLICLLLIRTGLNVLVSAQISASQCHKVNGHCSCFLVATTSKLDPQKVLEAHRKLPGVM